MDSQKTTLKQYRLLTFSVISMSGVWFSFNAAANENSSSPITENTSILQDKSADVDVDWIEDIEDDSSDEPFDMEETFDDVIPDADTDDTFSLLAHPLITPAHFTYRHELAYGIKNPKQLVINRSSLRLQWEKGQGRYFLRFDGKTDFDAIYNRNEFAGELKSKYRHQNNVRELFLQVSEGPLSIKLGHQLVIWGKADGGVITDIISPRNLTESVFTSVEDARIGQSMVVADLYLDGKNNQTQHQWSLVINPDIEVNEFPLIGHPYGPSSSLINTTGLPSSLTPVAIMNKKPGTSWNRPEVGVRWNVTQDKLDWSVMVAEVNDDNPVLSYLINNVGTGVIQTQYPRYQMLGGGFNWAKDGLVWKGELAFKKNRRIGLFTPQQYRIVDAALGFDYNANGAYTFSLEFTNQHLLNWDSSLNRTRRNESNAYMVWSKNWLNETLTTQYTSSIQLQNNESFHRFEFQYDVSDQWSVELQLDYFDSDEQNSFIGQLNDKHRISLQIDFDF